MLLAARGRLLPALVLGAVVVGTQAGNACATFEAPGAQVSGARVSDAQAPGAQVSDARARYRAMALQAQRFTWQRLAYTGGSVAGGPSDCASAPYVAYRRNTGQDTTISDHWYSALQVRADAALVRLGDEQYRCETEKAMAWMELLWAPSLGAYAPRADLDGSNQTLVDVYADDNAVIGLAFLETARITRDPALRARGLEGARRAASFLGATGVWDGTFGGGLWWTNQREQLGEGKHALPTALMAQLMAELYVETREPAYLQSARDALGWLDATLWNPHHELYAYGIDVDRNDPTRTVVTNGTFFGYDQAIAIQALLTLHRIEPGDGALLARAQRIGRAVDRAFWQPELGGYTLQASVLDLYAPYGAWISDALLDLYATDGDPFWRDRAQANLDALARVFGNGEGGYYRLAFKCVGERAALCGPGETYGLDRVVYTMSQATMQRAAALISAAY